MKEKSEKKVKKTINKSNKDASVAKKRTTTSSIKKANSSKKIVENKETKKSGYKVLTGDKKRILLQKKYSRLVFILLISIITIIFLVFLANKTFFRTEYRNKKLKLEIPVFMYFVSDKDGVVTFKTLRKSQNVRKYFDEYLSNLDNFDYYVCNNGKSFYYDDQNDFVIYDIEVKKNIAIKTIKVKYDVKSNSRVCE